VIRVLPGRASLVLLYMAGIFALSSLPGRELARFGLSAYLFNAAHAPLYAGLALTTLWALLGPTGPRCVLVAAIVMAFAISDEWHQAHVPGRFFSLADLWTDALGAGVGIALHEILQSAFALRRGEGPP
jgi:VanZ family protein